MMEKHLGISILAKFYIFLIFLYALPLFLFSTHAVILGKMFSATATFIINIIFVGLLWFLYLKIKNMTRIGFCTALVFHIFFTANSISMLTRDSSLLKVEGVKPINPQWINPILIANIIINMSIISYLLYRKKYFFHSKNVVTD